MRRINVHAGGRDYAVTICSRLADASQQLRQFLAFYRRPEKKSIFVLTSPDIWALWGKAFSHAFVGEPVILFLPPGERSKNVRGVERLAEEMASSGADRSSLLITIGGGVVGDMGGFLAATYMRGIDYVQVPTTFLAQVDSSVGGKTGVNLKSGKNLLGSFHHPRAVIAATEVLGTLDQRQLHAGLYESIKAGLIRNATLFRFIENHRDAIRSRDPQVLEKLVAASVRVKADVVGLDERESGLRMILNFGHTIGHAIEVVAGYGKMLHGEAVAWGMLASLDISQRRGWLAERDRSRADALIRYFAPPSLPKTKPEALLLTASRDKKNRGGTRRFVLLHGLGKAEIAENVTDAEIVESLGRVGTAEAPAAIAPPV